MEIKKDVKRFNIVVKNVGNFPRCENLAKQVELAEWKSEKWLRTCDLENLEVCNRVKTLVNKIITVYEYKGKSDEFYVDGYMTTLMSLLKMDDYPCMMYPQYIINAELGKGDDSENISSKCDFGIINKNKKSIIIVIEDKTMRNAKYQDNWKEIQVLGEIFVALHSSNYNTVYAVRIVANLFTFYRCTISIEYKAASLKKELTNEELVVERYPKIEPNELELNALDFYEYKERVQILEHLSYIHNQIV
ncbi:hypothetical protein CONCODRAFT_73862 [Conidiobolus coronatus NRRL 28638]|uniref:Uncharacterized protein n=1 Tax=Conidiobolus coronatus (strain ATCC 28846 / CBS 209.66 / NRRL 28638) TaxID=796925 RepID=A0A137NTX6_CONC2|nr:hypothetical protein CONCODRAFT_73862 [Conidiobolus coronatus NRRL 28638]|eukprot:KXN66148.1 hypothetical protein CONCODRAFT_73862 [Conidiobolus coronatus NRRL 28638]